MSHDQLWKTVLWAFFAEFVELFFPEVAERLDFSRIRLIEKEIFTDLPVGARREPDLLVEAYAKDGEVETILIHIEVQARREINVPYRMWEYYSLLRLRWKHRVFPVVVYLSAGAGGLTEEHYEESLFSKEIIRFRYSAVGLPDLPAEEYLERENILAPALSALMREERVSRVRRKLRAYQRLARTQLDDARRSLLVNVIDRYLKLNQEEEAEITLLVEDSDLQEVKEMLTAYEERGLKKGIERGIAQGIEQGITQGILRGKRETLLRLLRHRFNDLPEEVVTRIEQIEEAGELDALADKVLDARALEDMGLSND